MKGFRILKPVTSPGEYNWVNNPFTEFVTSTVDKSSNISDIQKEKNRKQNRESYHKRKRNATE